MSNPAGSFIWYELLTGDLGGNAGGMLAPGAGMATAGSRPCPLPSRRIPRIRSARGVLRARRQAKGL